MHGRLHGCVLAGGLALLLPLSLSLRAEEAPAGPCLAFSAGACASNALDADKDAQVRADEKLGESWRAATALDVAVHFDPARHDASARFSVAGSPYVWRLTPYTRADGEATDLFVLGPEPPPPPGGRWPSAVVAAIRSDAPIAFTRGRIQPGATDEEKNALVITELGAHYATAPIDRLRGAFCRAFAPSTEKAATRGSAEAFGLRITDGHIVLEVSVLSSEEREETGLPLAAHR